MPYIGMTKSRTHVMSVVRVTISVQGSATDAWIALGTNPLLVTCTCCPAAATVPLGAVDDVDFPHPATPTRINAINAIPRIIDPPIPRPHASLMRRCPCSRKAPQESSLHASRTEPSYI